jgi:hypothetical protein
MEQQPQSNGAIGHASLSDPIEVGDIYNRVHGVENKEEGIMANMATIKEGLKRLGSEHDNIEEASRIPLFEGSMLSSLCATLIILNCCCTHGVSTFIIELLGLFKKNILLAPNTLLSYEYEASSTLNRLGLAYDVINVCAKGCILFWGDHANIEQCIYCGEPRYMQVGKSTMP